MGEATYVLARRRYGLPEQTETYLARKLREELLLGPRMSVMVVAVGLCLRLELVCADFECCRSVENELTCMPFRFCAAYD